MTDRMGSTHNIPHGSCAIEEDTGVVGPLNVVQLGAVECIISTVVDKVFVADQADRADPVPHLIGLIGIGGISCIQCQTRRKVEVAAIRDGVFVVVTIVEGEDLPLESTCTGRRVPSNRL